MSFHQLPKCLAAAVNTNRIYSIASRAIPSHSARRAVVYATSAVPNKAIKQQLCMCSAVHRHTSNSVGSNDHIDLKVCLGRLMQDSMIRL
jgi:ribosomal protein S26